MFVESQSDATVRMRDVQETAQGSSMTPRRWVSWNMGGRSHCVESQKGRNDTRRSAWVANSVISGVVALFAHACIPKRLVVSLIVETVSGDETVRAQVLPSQSKTRAE